MLVGCAGWSIPTKVASVFPGQGTHLERYGQVFPCVEINSSFYRPHQSKTYARWADSVPAAFRFSVKMPRAITHERRLKDCEAPMRSFFEEVAPLGGKLGCVLVQLPPSLALDANEGARFFSLLRRFTRGPIVCEPRHASWFTEAGAALLDQHGIGYVLAHPSPVPEIERWCQSKLLYIRLHGAPRMYYSAYDEAFIEAVAVQMRLANEEGRRVWCIFDNTAQGEAVPNAMALLKQLGQGR